jgi:hypothetical protein
MLPSTEEREEAERRRANAEKQRAETAESLLDDARPVAQRDLVLWPALHRRTVSLQRDQVVTNGAFRCDAVGSRSPYWLVYDIRLDIGAMD